MVRCLRGLVLVAGLLSFVACESPTSSSSSTYDMDLTFTPSPATADASSGKSYTIKNASKPDETYAYSWVTTFTVTLKNSGTTGATISGLTIGVQQASGGIIMTSTTGDSEHYDYSSSPDSNRVEANGGTTNTTLTVWYTLPNGGKEAIITVNCSFKDDDDVTYSASDTVRVTP
jgi:hypothetical protein